MGNLALSAVVLFSLLVPGIILSYRYSSAAAGWEASGNVTVGVERLLCWGLLASLPFHVVWNMAIQSVNPWLNWGTLDFALLLNILQGVELKTDSVVFVQLHDSLLLKILSYVGTQVICAWFGGDLLAKAAVWLKWNKKLALSSKGAFWHQVFAYPEENPHFIVVTLAVSMGNINYLYDGVLHEYQLTDEGDLHRVVLLGATRRQLNGNSEVAETKMQGEYFALNCDKVQTANVDYLWIVSEEEEVHVPD